jgi:hypothetical protein
MRKLRLLPILLFVQNQKNGGTEPSEGEPADHITGIMDAHHDA